MRRWIKREFIGPGVAKRVAKSPIKHMLTEAKERITLIPMVTSNLKGYQAIIVIGSFMICNNIYHMTHYNRMRSVALSRIIIMDDNLNYHKPGSLYTPLDFGLVGFSFACGLGAKLANPERPVISLMGDGGFGMTVSELSTAVDHNINTVTIVMNNKCWGAEKAYQRDFFGERYIGADVSSPPFDKLAELYGAKGYKAETLDDVTQAVEAALKCDKPAVIDVAVDPSALYSFRRDSFTHRAK